MTRFKGLQAGSQPRIWISLFPVLFYSFLIFAFGIFITTLFQKGDLSKVGEQVFAGQTLYTVGLTLQYSILALILSWALALAFTRLQWIWRLPLFEILWVLPGFGYALIALFILKAIHVEDPYSMNSVLLAWVIAGTPYLALSFRNTLRDLDPREKEVLRTLGASPFKAWYLFDFRRTLSQQSYFLLQQFWLYLTSFSLVMILSGGPPNETLEVGIYTSIRLDQVNLPQATSLAIWQALILIFLRLLIRTPVSAKADLRTDQSVTGFRKSSLVIFAVIAMILAGYAWMSRFDLAGLGSSLIISFLLALCVCIAVIGVGMACYFSGFRWLAELGAWISPMVLTLAWWKAYAFELPTFLNCVMVQTVLFLPWFARSLFPVLARQRKIEIEAARTLGAAPVRAWIEVEWPRIREPALLVTGFLFSLSLTEVAAVILFSRGDFEPLSVWVQNSFMRFRLSEAAFGTVLLVAMSYLAIRQKRNSDGSV